MNKWVEADGGNSARSGCRGFNGYKDPLASHSGAWYGNLCGPGSSEAVISNWGSKPTTYNGSYATPKTVPTPYAYMFELAHEELTYNICPEDTVNYATWGTCTQKEADIINHEIGFSGYYAPDWCAGAVGTRFCGSPSLAEWKKDVSYDIQGAGIALVDEVYTCDTSNSQCLPGWPQRADHFNAMSQYAPTGGNKYGETGNAADACVLDDYGYAAPGAYSKSGWPDPNGGTYKEQSGWDYVSNFFHWERSRDLIW